MARTETPTLLPLDRWAQIVGLDPRHFNQITTAADPPTVCSTVWKQFNWQDAGQLGREDVAQAIKEAEDTISQFLGYRLKPTWDVDERHPTPQPLSRDAIALTGLDLRGFAQTIQANKGFIISGGLEGKTVILAGAAVVWTDPDGDGYNELGTIIVPTTVTEPCEIVVYYPGEAAADEWEIEPLRSVVIAGGTATITIDRHQAVDASLLEALQPTAVDGNVDGNFLATVDVFRHFNDPQQQVQFLWRQFGSGCNCGTDTCVICGWNTQFGCLTPTNHRSGLFAYRPGTFDAVTQDFDSAAFSISRLPDNLRLWYYAGYQSPNRTYPRNCPRIEMDSAWERAVAYYALALIDRNLCDCNNIQKAAEHWSEDLALEIEQGSYQLSQRVLDNPLGTRRGAIHAWERIIQPGQRKGQAVLL